MKKTKLLQLLSRLTKDELNSFELYVTQRYSSQKVPLTLLQHIASYHPNFEAPKMNQQIILNEVLQLENAPLKRVSNEFHKIFEWLIDFLILDHTRKGSLIREQLTLEIFRKRKLSQLFIKKAEAVKLRIKKMRLSPWNYLSLMQVSYLLYYYAATPKFKSLENHIIDTVHALKIFYQLNILKLDCELRSRSTLFQEQAISLTPPKWEPDQASAAKPLLVELYEQFHLFTKTPSVGLFNALKERLIEIHPKISQVDNLIFLNILVNYAIKSLGNGDSSFITQLGQLYRFAVDQKLSLESGFISTARFRNAITVAAELNQIQWAKEFMLSHINHIPEKYRSNVLPIAQAQILFAQGRFDETLDQLHSIDNFIDFGYKVQTRLLQIKCYYELGAKYDRVILSNINSFDNSLSRNTFLTKEITNRYRNFLKILRLLVRSNRTKTRKEILDLLNTQPSIVAKPWLIAKIRSY